MRAVRGVSIGRTVNRRGLVVVQGTGDDSTQRHTLPNAPHWALLESYFKILEVDAQIIGVTYIGGWSDVYIWEPKP